MNEGPSFSFLSESSQKYPPISLHSLSKLDSDHHLHSLIQTLPQATPDFRGKTQVVLLLQAAEIERLSLTLDAFKAYYEQPNSSLSKDDPQGQPSAHLLSNGSISKFNESFPAPNALRQGSQGSIVDASRYLQKLENKYKRALKYIEVHAAARSQLEAALAESKEELVSTRANFEAFKKSSIREYQILREESDNARRAELSFELRETNTQKLRMREMLSSKDAELQSQKERFEEALRKQRQNLEEKTREVQRIFAENEDCRRNIEKAEVRHRELANEKENALALASLEMERLNAVLREKTCRFQENQAILSEKMTAAQEEINLLQREVERGRQKVTQLEEETASKRKEIQQLEKHSASLSARISEMGTAGEERNSQIRSKESQLTQELKHLSALLSKSEENYAAEIQHYKAANARLTADLAKSEEVIKTVREGHQRSESSLSSTIQGLTSEVQVLRKELLVCEDQVRRGQDELKLARSKWDFEKRGLERKMEEAMGERRRELEISQLQQSGLMEKSKQFYSSKMQEMEKRIGEYEERLRKQHQIQLQLSSQNSSLKTALEQSQKSKSSIRNRSFEQLFQEIEVLCSHLRQKQTCIESLNHELNSLNEASRQHFQETLNLREMLTKLLALVELLEHTRKEDQKTLTLEMRRLFEDNSHLVDRALEKQAWEHKTDSEYHTRSIIQSKDSQISVMKNQIEQFQQHKQDQQGMQQVVAKVISLTKENSELKSTLSKQEAQIQALSQEKAVLERETREQFSRLDRCLSQKEEQITGMRRGQEESGRALLEQQQTTIRWEAVAGELELQNKNLKQQLGIREAVIADLKASLEFRNQQNSKTSSAMEEQLRKTSHLNEQINQLKKSYNYQIAAKSEELELNRTQLQHLQQQLETLTTTLREREQIILTLKESLQERQTASQVQSTQEQSAPYPCPRCLYLEKTVRDRQAEEKELRTSLQILRAEHKAFQEEQGARSGYSDKIPALNRELARLQAAIEELKLKNSTLVMSNHELSIKVEQEQFTRQKMGVLNRELERLQAHNVDLLQEVNAYRLQIWQEGVREREGQELCALIVMLSAEVEALREGTACRERELAGLRKAHLGSS